MVKAISAILMSPFAPRLLEAKLEQASLVTGSGSSLTKKTDVLNI